MKTSLHEQLVMRLGGYKGMHALIARECGIAQATISRVARGEVSPTLAVAQPIFDWMDRQEAVNKRVLRVVAKAPAIRQKPKKQNTDGRNLRNLKPASAVHA